MNIENIGEEIFKNVEIRKKDENNLLKYIYKYIRFVSGRCLEQFG